ncbi:MAG: glycosyl transferase family protein [Zetaproteobacteria bacterium]|nr:MAG: glycosyl transferase family protein [Zetaproteobacteria bacterium]
MMGIAELIHRVARGKHGSKDLSRDESGKVFATLLQPDADALQLGAFLIAERIKGETASELAGFVDAARSRIKGFEAFTVPEGTIDLPCYAGKRRAAPLHLVAALQARDAGIPVFVHGITHIEGRVTAWQALKQVGVKRAGVLRQAMEILAGDGIVYMDVADICPDLLRILQLRPRLGVRSFAHTVARMLNPLGCTGQLNGMFHTPYARHMAEANILLGQHCSLIFMGAEGEPELYADRQKELLLQQGKRIRSLQYADAGVECYPKEKSNKSNIIGTFIKVKHKINPDRREAAVLERMREAFRLVSTGTLPEGWRESS